MSEQVKMDIAKKSKKRKKYIYLFIALFALLLIAVLQGIYLAPGALVSDLFIIKKGEGLQEISTNLAKAGLIKSKYLFQAFAVIYGKQNKLMAGAYDLTGMNTADILDKLTAGGTIRENLTIIEGWNLRDIAWNFENKGMFQAEELFEIIGFPPFDDQPPNEDDIARISNFSDQFGFLKEKPKNIGLEGYLFPDTYEIARYEELLEIVVKILKNFEDKVVKELEQDLNLFEVLTMASLLEKEVKTYEDKQIVAGILWKRLRNGWKLQVDATLTYITGRGSSGLTKDDLEIDSLYNTYKYYGLPLGPICNPGLESIHAAVYYKDSDFWYYLTTSDGETIFSRTLEEHNINRGKYLK